jgi:hypothetical protein
MPWPGDGATVGTLRVNNGTMPASAERFAGGRTRASLVRVLLGLIAVVCLTAAGSAAPSPSAGLHSGTEGTKAALVRIELSAVAEIVHIDHSSGEVEVARGGTTVPLGAGTGVLVSADGIVATTWENIRVDQDQVAVYAANELFAKVIGVPIVGNDGDPAQRGSTPDPYWGPHLHHCYDQVTHCVHFRVPQYHVRTYTTEPGGVMAELLNSPSGPQDVALLRISGGGGAPTATVAAADATHGPEDLLLGFTKRPGPEGGPVELPVTLDTAAGLISSPEDLAAPFDAGVSGGPVVDPSTGQVIGLAGPRQDDGSATLVTAAQIRAAMAEAGVEPSSSKFDAVFRRGIDHLSSGNPGRSAQGALEESLTYYDSALATSHLHQAQAAAEPAESTGAAAATGPGEDAGGPQWGTFLLVLIGALLVAGIIAALILGRRRTPATAGADGQPPETGRWRSVPASVASVLPARWRGDTHPNPAPRHSRSADGAAPPDAGPVNGGARSADTRTGSAPDGHDDRRFCSQCGRAAGPGARFCTDCGHPVG